MWNWLTRSFLPEPVCYPASHIHREGNRWIETTHDVRLILREECPRCHCYISEELTWKHGQLLRG